MELTTAFILALIAVESGGRDHAVGDDGNAFGCLQIWQCVVDDVNRVAKTNYIHKDAFSRNDAIFMLEVYIGHYCTEKRLGRKPTLEDAARIWVGGPNGYKKRSTIKYWLKVKAHL